MSSTPPTQPEPKQRPYLRWAAQAAVAILIAVAARYGIPIPPAPVLQMAAAQEQPLDYDGTRIEGDNHAFHMHEMAEEAKKWPTKKLTYWIDWRGSERIRPALSQESLRAAFRTSWGYWTEVIDLDVQEVSTESEALIRHRFADLDGPSRTLAWSYLSDGTLSPKEQRYDIAETWTAGAPAPNMVCFSAVAAHEIGHVLGLEHDGNNANAIMKPYYDSKIPAPLQRDFDRLVALGYVRRSIPVPPPIPPTGDELQFPVRARITDLTNALQNAGYTVTPPPKQRKD